MSPFLVLLEINEMFHFFKRLTLKTNARSDCCGYFAEGANDYKKVSKKLS